MVEAITDKNPTQPHKSGTQWLELPLETVNLTPLEFFTLGLKTIRSQRGHPSNRLELRAWRPVEALQDIYHLEVYFENSALAGMEVKDFSTPGLEVRCSFF